MYVELYVMAHKKDDIDFLPSKRSSKKEIDLQHQEIENTFLESAYLKKILDVVPGMVAILNNNRQIIFANKSLKEFGSIDNIEPIYGLRTGEYFRCIHSDEKPGGCGTTEFCEECGAAKTIVSALKGNEDVQECRLVRKEDSAAFEFEVSSAPIKIGKTKFLIFSIVDISDEKRREALERIFFHDILNISGALEGYSALILDADPENTKSFAEKLHNVTLRLIDEIVAQRQLLQAEKGELILSKKDVNSLKTLNQVADMYVNHHIAREKEIRIDPNAVDKDFTSDPALLNRVVGNMLKNALEASKSGKTVTLGATVKKGRIEYWVNNPAFMPRDVQLQVFQRSFSTKGTGRGLGTYSIKLLSEQYMDGLVGFKSSKKDGTTFFASYPVK
jgi:signal transduction histidine kinase